MDAELTDDDLVAWFMSIVDCNVEDVRDVPPERLHVHPLTIDPSSARKAAGDFELPFGKHKGKRLREVPEDYLYWMIGVLRPIGSMKKAARFARTLLESK